VLLSRRRLSPSPQPLVAVKLRRFPPPWSVEDIGAAFGVKDNTGQRLAYIYFEDEPGRRSAAQLLTRISRGTDADLAKRKAAELPALKLGWNKLVDRI
jgi:hypothetical protein